MKVTIDTQQTSAPVSKYLYGQFIEHIGSTMYGSLWAEMLDDRKFYFPITAKKPEPAGRPQGGPSACGFANGILSAPKTRLRWTRRNRLLATRARASRSTPPTPHGIQQSGLALVNGKKYSGRIYLRGTPGSKVKVSLIWGAGENDRQTIAFPCSPMSTRSSRWPSPRRPTLQTRIH